VLVNLLIVQIILQKNNVLELFQQLLMIAYGIMEFAKLRVVLHQLLAQH
jgi:hypothetical protein